jgi:hypothetical protein
MAAAYSTAMLYTRHNDPEDRSDQIAKAWLNSAIATASLEVVPTVVEVEVMVPRLTPAVW